MISMRGAPTFAGLQKRISEIIDGIAPGAMLCMARDIELQPDLKGQSYIRFAGLCM